MTPDGLLSPGFHRARGSVDDGALVATMLRVEVAWLRAMVAVGAVDPEHADVVAEAAAEWHVDLVQLAADSEDAGNAVVPLVRGLRDVVGGSAAEVIHRGLTSQDVLDTALVLLARDALVRARTDLAVAARSLAALAEAHRGTIMVGRTLTQHAVPITFGLKAARWLAGVLDAIDQVDTALTDLPVQCGGAAGTLALVGELTADPVAAAQALAHQLDLVWPGVPWHTNRSPVTRIGDAAVGACDALGRFASDVALMSRPEIAEVREGSMPGRGGSSTMPHKRNPVLSVLIRSMALQAPLLGAQLHLAAAQAVDERPDGAWHAEWPALGRLLALTVTAASQAAELATGLEVDADVMRRRVEDAADNLLAEQGGGNQPADYLGATSAFIDAILTRMPDRDPDRG